MYTKIVDNYESITVSRYHNKLSEVVCVQLQECIGQQQLIEQLFSSQIASPAQNAVLGSSKKNEIISSHLGGVMDEMETFNDMKFNLPMQELDIVPEIKIDKEALEKTGQSNKEYKLTCKVSKQ